MLQRLKTRIAGGLTVTLAGVKLEIRLGRARSVKPDAQAPNLELGYACALEDRFPELRTFGLELRGENAADIVEFYVSYLPLIHEASRGAHLRSLLCRLRSRTEDPTLRGAVTRAIAISNMRDGIPDRAVCLRGDPTMGAEWAAQVRELEIQYGAQLLSEDWSQASRGSSLVLYFEANRQLLNDKEVLHFGPETELRTWFEEHSSELGIRRYSTVDGMQPHVDELHDITNMGVADNSFDVVICHRVMEHVLDDAKGFSELFRILRPGGLLNFSVPQAPHRALTAEWLVPDDSHHGHVRHYGRDLEERMAHAGFRVGLEPWLLALPLATLRARGAYPLRMYNAWR